MRSDDFERAALAMHGNGYSPLPIAPRVEPTLDRPNPPSGKEPGKFDAEKSVWFRLKKWNLLCERQAHPQIIRHWSSWPDVGLGVATGFGGLVAVDIDDDVLIAPLLDVLPPVVVAKRGRKGATYFFVQPTRCLQRTIVPLTSTAFWIF